MPQSFRDVGSNQAGPSSPKTFNTASGSGWAASVIDFAADKLDMNQSVHNGALSSCWHHDLRDFKLLLRLRLTIRQVFSRCNTIHWQSASANFDSLRHGYGPYGNSNRNSFSFRSPSGSRD